MTVPTNLTKKPVKPDTPCGVFCHKFVLKTCVGNDPVCKEYEQFLDDSEKYMVLNYGKY